MQVNVHEAKTNLSRLLARVEQGEEVIVARSGRPVAVLTPYRDQRPPVRLGLWAGRIHLAEDWDSDETNAEIARDFGAV